METKSPSNGVVKSKLENLPGSEDEFWEDAEIHTNLVPHTEFSEKGHYFILVAGRTAECKNCHWGFELDRGDKIDKGHLYDRKGKFVI
jgi:hypothetical protein